MKHKKFISIFGKPCIGKTTFIKRFIDSNKLDKSISHFGLGDSLVRSYYKPESEYYSYFTSGKLLPFEAVKKVIKDWIMNNESDIILGDNVPLSLSNIQVFQEMNLKVNTAVILDDSMTISDLYKRSQERSRKDDVNIEKRLKNWDEYMSHTLTYLSSNNYTKIIKVDVSPFQNNKKVFFETISKIIHQHIS